MSVQFVNIIGNRALKERLSDEIEGKTFPHAYIIEGPEGSGRHTLARNIAAALSCLSQGAAPCGCCKNCKKIFSDSSPDIIIQGIGEDKTTIGVDVVRRIRDDMATAPNDLDIKVYIVEDADSLTPQAQNAFLLSLEEPPAYVIFFLICENSSSLLETVRSRAPVLRLERLSCGEVEKYLLDNDKRASQLINEDKAAFDTVIFAADGCIGKALELLDAKKRKRLLDERATVHGIISALSSKDRAKVLSALDSLGNKRPEIARSLISVQNAVRDLMLLKKADNVKLCFYPIKEEAAELSSHYSSASLILLYDALCGASDELEANSNVRVTLLNMAQKANLI